MSRSFTFDSSQCELIEQRVRLAGEALCKRFGAELASAEIDLIFTHYLLGLVTALQADATPARQLESVSALAALLLAPEEVQCALHSVPPGEETFVSRALHAAEKIGRRDGEALLAASAQGAADLTEPQTATAS